MFSTHILRQQFEVVNYILPTGESLASQYLVHRAISLLSLRPNGSFLSYLQIGHVTAAMSYAVTTPDSCDIDSARVRSICDKKDTLVRVTTGYLSLCVLTGFIVNIPCSHK
ncbi:hypothetical protein V1527DRAFT_34068 [Lipomyces starkeyi]